ncbi:hypothetical protein [Bacillus sp. SM2101]|uniref:hypothetical protein n=1 Tax=Bacillus sp. SM2101 TaxID=2805366 RepID=UPI001BDE3F1D|nr:hypothetical protein [Bacillus sp. SM2101]
MKKGFLGVLLLTLSIIVIAFSNEENENQKLVTAMNKFSGQIMLPDITEFTIDDVASAVLIVNNDLEFSSASYVFKDNSEENYSLSVQVSTDLDLMRQKKEKKGNYSIEFKDIDKKNFIFETNNRKSKTYSNQNSISWVEKDMFYELSSENFSHEDLLKISKTMKTNTEYHNLVSIEEGSIFIPTYNYNKHLYSILSLNYQGWSKAKSLSFGSLETFTIAQSKNDSFFTKTYQKAINGDENYKEITLSDGEKVYQNEGSYIVKKGDIIIFLENYSTDLGSEALLIEIEKIIKGLKKI